MSSIGADRNAVDAETAADEKTADAASPGVFRRSVEFAGLLAVSWCVMTFTHEAGHLVGGWIGGGQLQSASLWPWPLPHSIFQPDPRPLVTLWGGPLLGAAVPLILALLTRRNGASRNWAWFVADFCVLANGLYLAAGWMAGDRHLDTTRLLENGAHPVGIALYCAVTIPVGYVGFRRQCIRVLSPPARRGETL